MLAMRACGRHPHVHACTCTQHFVQASPQHSPAPRGSPVPGRFTFASFCSDSCARIRLARASADSPSEPFAASNAPTDFAAAAGGAASRVPTSLARTNARPFIGHSAPPPPAPMPTRQCRSFAVPLAPAAASPPAPSQGQGDAHRRGCPDRDNRRAPRRGGRWRGGMMRTAPTAFAADGAALEFPAGVECCYWGGTFVAGSAMPRTPPTVGAKEVQVGRDAAVCAAAVVARLLLLRMCRQGRFRLCALSLRRARASGAPLLPPSPGACARSNSARAPLLAASAAECAVPGMHKSVPKRRMCGRVSASVTVSFVSTPAALLLQRALRKTMYRAPVNCRFAIPFVLDAACMRQLTQNI
eukprot:282160-Chlamydomonas_euryale.AAC.7